MRLLANGYVRLFGGKRFYRWNQRLLNLAVRGMGVGNPSTDLIGESEGRLLRRLAAVPDLTVFDVGAHVGEYASQVRKLCPRARIWSFEPHPASFRELKKVADRDGFEAVNVALSDVSGSASLYDHALAAAGVGSAHASLHAQVIERIHHGQSMKHDVNVTTVDEFMQVNTVERLTLLKVDAEGHELAILRGAKQAIDAGAVDLVQFEFNEMNVMSRVFFKDFYDALPGFTLYRMVSDGLAKVGPYQPRTHELFILQNVVAIRDDVEYGAALV
ncbi:MAG TPA: FkbM family methyltransferase [Candidatus Dormibacteraeota bacterium]|nr:FkbM family methyltransferase [Candidatus Dormibacteraeota bacterium]